jgi:hypothetical protein
MVDKMIELIETQDSEDSCFSSADMCDQAAKAFREGYRQALLDIANGEFTESAKEALKVYDTQRTNDAT